MQPTTSLKLHSATVAAVFALCGHAAQAAAVSLPADLATWTCTGSCGSSTADGDIGLSPTANARYGYVTTHGSTAAGVAPSALVAVSDDDETNGSRIVSTSFGANDGDRLSIHFNYVSTDGKGYDDYAWARLLTSGGNFVAWLFVAQSTNTGTKSIVPGDVGKDKDIDFDPKSMIEDFDKWDFQTKSSTDPVDWSRLGPDGGSNKTCWEDNAPGCGYTGWLKSNYTIAGGGNYRVEIGVTNLIDEAYDSGLAFDFLRLSDSGATAAAPVPEPATPALLALALGAMGFASRRRDQRREAAP